MARKRVKVIRETDSGRNLEFLDTRTHTQMSRAEFVKKIEGGGYPNYHVRKIHGIKTPVSNPDETEDNNLG